MKSKRTKAIVLRRTNYGEADRVVQFLTAEEGKLSVMARGVRKEKSKLAGGIELFARCDITMIDGKGELRTLTGARIENFYRNILADFDRLTFGYETIKQISKAADSLDEPAFFELLDQAFQSLDDTSIDTKIVKIWFWLQLAILMGVGLNLATDDQGAKLTINTRYDFDMSQSVLSAREHGRFSSDHIKVLRISSAQPPRVINQVEGISELLDDCLWIAERAIAH